TSPIPNEATIALGTSSMSLLELTSAYAAILAERYPVHAHGLEAAPAEHGIMAALTDRTRALDGTIHDEMLDLLSASAETGTGRAAALSVKTYGKTGTTQDSRDALFVG
ncbi:penicillin-binding protein, partial [Pseudomonas sp. FW305-130]